MKALDDNKIVELFLLRDETAIKQISEKYGSRLRSLAYGIVNDQQTSEECENDTYMEAWNAIPPMSQEATCMFSLLGLLVTFL